MVTDSNPLTYVLSTAKLDATGYRWLAALSTYNFTLQYRSGKQNIDADGLSRRPNEKLPTDDVSLRELNRILNFTEQLTKNSNEYELSDDVVKAICESRLIQWPECPNDSPIAFVSSLAMQETAVHNTYAHENQCGGLPIIPHLSLSEFQSAQLADPCIREVIAQLQTGESPSSTVRNALPRLPYLLREKDLWTYGC